MSLLYPVRQTAASLGAGLVLGLGGCASEPPKPAPAKLASELVVILPGPDGKAGGVVVERAGQTQVLDRPFAASKVSADGKLEAATLDQPSVHNIFAATLEAMPGKPASFLVYFLEGKDELTTESKQAVESILEELKRRPAPDIQVIGHTDTVGSESFNDRLSLQRAEKLREMLAKILSLPLDQIQAAGRGERDLLVPTADNVAEARNRRVEISVR